MKSFKLILFLIVALLPLLISADTLFTAEGDYIPVIGILTQPAGKFHAKHGYPGTKYSYIAASYVKYIESSGARVVPIQWDLPLEQIDEILSKVNGVLLPGGGNNLVTFYRDKLTYFGAVGDHIVKRALEFNRKGDYFPVWGTCLGYEMLVLSLSGNYSLLTRVKDGGDVAKALAITDSGKKGIFANAEFEITSDIEKKELAYFHHRWTPDPKVFENDENLKSNFTVAAFAKDSLVGRYAAVIQGKKWPFSGLQFHPEKNTFEHYELEHIPHTPEAKQMQEFFSDYFVKQSCNNTHEFDSEEEFRKYSIRRYKTVHLPRDQFEQEYFFRNYKKPYHSIARRHARKI